MNDWHLEKAFGPVPPMVHNRVTDTLREVQTMNGRKARPLAAIIAAALLAVLALCLTVPKAINTAGENNVEDVQDTHLDELAAAREAIADHRETTISAGALYTIGLKSDGTVVAVCDNAYGQNDVSSWTDIALPE